MQPSELSIIIVNWNSADYLMKCIRSIYEETTVLAFEIIVVDNASYDGCAERLAQNYPDVIFIQNRLNSGFAAANNLGASRARGSVLLFLNPDTVILDKAIERMFRKVKALPDVGVAGCRLLNSDGSIQTACVQPIPRLLNQFLDTDVLRSWFPKSPLWGNAVLFEKHEAPVEVEAVSGACMMIRREVFERIGHFSSDYFMYAEDLDLCYKARLAGLRNYHVPDSILVHHGGGSVQKARDYFSIVMMRESVYRFLCKTQGLWYGFRYRLGLAGAAVIRLVLILALSPVYALRHRLEAWAGSFRKWTAILCWSLGFQRWSKHYDSAKKPAAIAGGIRAER